MTDTTKEQQIKREEQKVQEEKQLQDFLGYMKALVKRQIAYHSGWIRELKRFSVTGDNPNEEESQYWIRAIFREVYDTFYLSELSELGIDGTFSFNYENKLESIANGHWIVPSCVAIKMFDVDNPKHLSLWLDLPHRSEVDPVGSLSYYRTMQDVIRVRETRTKPGRWFGARELGTEAEGLTFNSHWTSTGTPLAKHFFLSETKGLSEESWKWSYGNTDRATGSCMIKAPDAARIFAYDDRLDLFYITEDDTPDGKIIVRTIVRNDTKKYIRLYSSSHNKSCQAKSTLTSLGYSEERNLHGIKLGKVKPDNMLDDSELYWLSYLDSHSDTYVVDAKDHWVCHDTNYESQKERDHRYDSNYHDGMWSKGYFGVGKCSCGKRGYDLYIAYSVKDGKVGVKTACGACSDKYYVKESDYSQSYYDKNHFIFVKDYSVDEEDYDEDCYYETKVYRKGEEIPVANDYMLVESEDGWMIDHKENFKTDFFGKIYNSEHEDVRDFLDFCDKSLSSFLIKDLEDNNIELSKSIYYNTPTIVVVQHSEIYNELVNCTYYDWSSRKVVKDKIKTFLEIFEKQGKLKAGSYNRYLASIGKMEAQEKVYTFRSNNTGNMGFVLDTGEASGNMTEFAGYTFVQAA